MIDDATYLELLSYLEDELTVEEQERFVARLEVSPQLADQLVRVAGDQVHILQWARSEGVLDVSRECDEASGAFASSRRLSALMLAVAASLLIAVGVTVNFRTAKRLDERTSAANQAAAGAAQPHPGRNGGDAIAHVAEFSPRADWFIENRIHRDKRVVSAGDTLRVNKGQIDIRFSHGTLMTLRAPALLEVHDSMSTRVHRGSVRVDVAKGAEGFQVATPLARVTDLGTKFGVDVDAQGRTEVAVFEGAVDVQGGVDEQAHLPKLQRLRAGEAVVLDARGTVSRVVTIAGDRFPHSGVTSDAVPAIRPLIVSQVRDNIERDASFKFYEIVRGGMREDARAFVDRPYHEWNGLTPDGMPGYLVGGDYVKTFNSDKVNPQIQIQLTLAQPATVYLLLDDRVPIPSWLPRLFEDTGDDIGLDEGYDVSSTNQKNSVGAGQSIDNTFSIWKCVVPRPGVLKLGAIEKLAAGPNPWWINMYGIVAVPLTTQR